MNGEAKYYGVSSGDGNNGVSHIFPDYIVKTSEPWRLAELAAISNFTTGKGQEWAKENVQIDGEEEYTISAVFYESPETQAEIAAMQARLDEMDEDDSEREELESDIEGYGLGYAWSIYEVYPWDSEYKAPNDTGRPVFESLDDAFGADMVAAIAA